MGFIIFLLLFGALCLFFLIVGIGLSLFSAIFGYDRDPYEEELRRMDFEDEIFDYERDPYEKELRRMDFEDEIFDRFDK